MTASSWPPSPKGSIGAGIAVAGIASPGVAVGWTIPAIDVGVGVSIRVGVSGAGTGAQAADTTKRTTNCVIDFKRFYPAETLVSLVYSNRVDLSPITGPEAYLE